MIDLKKCLPGQAMRLTNGDVVTYVGHTDKGHLVEFTDHTHGLYTDTGHIIQWIYPQENNK